MDSGGYKPSSLGIPAGEGSWKLEIGLLEELFFVKVNHLKKTIIS